MNKVQEDLIEQIGLLMDKVENLTYSIKMHISPAIHVEQMKSALPEIHSELTNIYGKLIDKAIDEL